MRRKITQFRICLSNYILFNEYPKLQSATWKWTHIIISTHHPVGRKKNTLEIKYTTLRSLQMKNNCSTFLSFSLKYNIIHNYMFVCVCVCWHKIIIKVRRYLSISFLFLERCIQPRRCFCFRSAKKWPILVLPMILMMSTHKNITHTISGFVLCYSSR